MVGRTGSGMTGTVASRAGPPPVRRRTASRRGSRPVREAQRSNSTVASGGTDAARASSVVARVPAQHPARDQGDDDVGHEDPAVDRAEDLDADLGGLRHVLDEHPGEQADPGEGLGDGDDPEGGGDGAGVHAPIVPEPLSPGRPGRGVRSRTPPQAAGQPELLELPDVALERQRLPAQRRGEVGRPDAGPLGDQPQHLAGPRAVARAASQRSSRASRARRSSSDSSACSRRATRGSGPARAHLHPVDVRARAGGRAAGAARPATRTPAAPGVVLGERRRVDLVDRVDPDDARRRCAGCCPGACAAGPSGGRRA